MAPYKLSYYYYFILAVPYVRSQDTKSHNTRIKGHYVLIRIDQQLLCSSTAELTCFQYAFFDLTATLYKGCHVGGGKTRSFSDLGKI